MRDGSEVREESEEKVSLGGDFYAMKSWVYLFILFLVILVYLFHSIFSLFHFIDVVTPRIFHCVGLSVIGFVVTLRTIPQIHPLLERASLFGFDINKKGTHQGSIKIPEALGIVSSTIFIIILCFRHLFIPKATPFSVNNLHTTVEIPNFNNNETAAVAAVTFMTLLGFADDVLDLKWRHKMILPFFGCLPLLSSYSGSTSIRIPLFLSPLITNFLHISTQFKSNLSIFFFKCNSLFTSFLNNISISSQTHDLISSTIFVPTLSSIYESIGITVFEIKPGYPIILNLGVLFYLYMALLSIFCTNAINIYAGINGLEVGQSIIIGCFIIIHNIQQIQLQPNQVDNLELVIRSQLISLEMMIPFVAVSLALLKFNAYPSTVFVGDTYCYFAGMTLAMAAILGHFPETLLVFFIPQIINFLYSIPQLIGIVHCPRHRLPKYNEKTGKLEGIKSNLNLVNLVLLITGPLSEKTLCDLLLVLQVVSCICGLALRHTVVKYIL